MRVIIPKGLDEEIKYNLSSTRLYMDEFLKQRNPNLFANRYTDKNYILLLPTRHYLLFGKTDQANQEILFPKYKLSFIINATGYDQDGEPIWYNIHDKGRLIEKIIDKTAETLIQAKNEELTTIGTLSTRPKMFKPFPDCFGKDEIEFSSGMFDRISRELAVDNCVLILYIEDPEKYFGLDRYSKPVEIQME